MKLEPNTQELPTRRSKCNLGTRSCHLWWPFQLKGSHQLQTDLCADFESATLLPVSTRARHKTGAAWIIVLAEVVLDKAATSAQTANFQIRRLHRPSSRWVSKAYMTRSQAFTQSSTKLPAQSQFIPICCLKTFSALKMCSINWTFCLIALQSRTK